MQQTFLNILKKYFNVIKALADFFFCLVGYIWPKSIKNYAVLAMIKRSRISDIRFSVLFFFVFWVKKTLYFIIIIGKEIKTKITLLTGINRFRNDNNTWGMQEQKR